MHREIHIGLLILRDGQVNERTSREGELQGQTWVDVHNPHCSGFTFRPMPAPLLLSEDISVLLYPQTEKSIQEAV
jgi:hypothetical protein